MDDDDKLARRFEASRPRLRAMAYRMLGSLGDAEDAVQEGWLRAAGADSDDVANMEGWFTTIVARVCLDMLRSRKSRREEPLDPDDAVAAGFEPGYEQGPEQEAMLADSVGLAMLVVLDNLAPAERVAFVLHDTFGLPFGEIAAITGRTPASARQLASRARRRIQGSEHPRPRRARQREMAEAFLAAARGGDPRPAGHGGRAAGRARYGRVALINGTPGLIVAPRGRLVLALAFTYSGDTISQIDVIADPDRLAALDLAVVEP